MRTCVAWFGGFFWATSLNIVVPVVAFYRGDIKLPNVMISDVMAAHPAYEAVYSWGFSMTMLNSCFILREASLQWRKTMPELAPVIARFMALLYGVCAPCLFGTIAFQYKHDLDIFKSKLNLDFLMWLLHCSFASVFFLTAATMALIYGWRLHPVLTKKNLVHPADRFWRYLAVNGMMVLFAAGVVVRGFHLFHDAAQWCILLTGIEVGMIQSILAAVFIGTSRDMMALDATEPIFDISDLLHAS